MKVRQSRAGLKNAFCKMLVTMCGRFYLKEGGVAVVNRKAMQPVTATLGGGGYDGEAMIAYLKKHVHQLYVIDGEAICQKAGSPKVLNVALLGVALGSKVLDIQMEDMKAELARRVKPQYAKMNVLALELGAAAAQSRDYNER